MSIGAQGTPLDMSLAANITHFTVIPRDPTFSLPLSVRFAHNAPGDDVKCLHPETLLFPVIIVLARRAIICSNFGRLWATAMQVTGNNRRRLTATYHRDVSTTPSNENGHSIARQYRTICSIFPTNCRRSRATSTLISIF